MRFQFSDGKIITADSCEEFVRKMRKSSFFPGESVATYMSEVSERLSKFDFIISTTNADTFVSDLQASGVLTVIEEAEN